MNYAATPSGQGKMMAPLAVVTPPYTTCVNQQMHVCMQSCLTSIHLYELAAVTLFHMNTRDDNDS